MAYRVWTASVPPGYDELVPVESPEDGARLINLWDRQPHHPMLMSTFVSGLLTDADGEWSEWYDDDGEDVSALAKRLRNPGE